MSLRNTEKNWGVFAIILHWLSAITILGLFALGFWMVRYLHHSDSLYRVAPHVHKSIGVILLILMTIRLLWRMCNKVPRPLYTHTRFEQVLSKCVHYLLYFFTFSVLITGYLMSSAVNRHIPVFNWFEAPPLFFITEEQTDLIANLHLYFAWIIICLFGLHLMGALKHHFINRDTTLTRMLGVKNNK